MKKTRTIEELPIDSTKLCCNFVNTVYSWKGEDNYDFLNDYNTFIDWCVKLSLSDGEYLNRLRTHAKRNPKEARTTMEEFRKLRDLLHGFISAIARRDQNKITKLIVVVNSLFTDAFNNMKLEYDGKEFVLSYKIKPINLKSPIWIIVKSLYDLLTEMEMIRIKECPTCGWVFFDETKNGKRKWCNPLNCGTQDKMSRYNQKLREQNINVHKL
jgi:predicted RNA-binding Zn ribbon-like protein